MQFHCGKKGVQVEVGDHRHGEHMIARRADCGPPMTVSRSTWPTTRVSDVLDVA
jgi:hypothetical protein